MIVAYSDRARFAAPSSTCVFQGREHSEFSRATVTEKRRNHPSYFVVVVLGVLFTVSACAYGVMSFRASRGGDAYSATESDAGLMRLMRERGGTILAVEIVLLAIASVAAMASDRRDNAGKEPEEPPSTLT